MYSHSPLSWPLWMEEHLGGTTTRYGHSTATINHNFTGSMIFTRAITRPHRSSEAKLSQASLSQVKATQHLRIQHNNMHHIWAKCCMLANQPDQVSLFLVTSSSCTGHSSCASALKFKYIRVNLYATYLAKFHGLWPILWPDLWPLEIGHKFYNKFLICSDIMI